MTAKKLWHQEKEQQATWGFAQVWLDGSTINSFANLSSGSGGTSNAELFVLNFNKITFISSGYGQTEY